MNRTASGRGWRTRSLDTRPLQGLVAISLLLNNWDSQDQQQSRSIVCATTTRNPQQRYVVQDLGASLGKPRGLPDYRGTRNDIDDFEDSASFRRSTDRKVLLDYKGQHTDILKKLSPLTLSGAASCSIV